MLMALEGLRTVEVHRMSVNDINWEMKTIYIHGKGIMILFILVMMFYFITSIFKNTTI